MPRRGLSTAGSPSPAEGQARAAQASPTDGGALGSRDTAEDAYLTVAISSRALFDLDASDAVYREQGLEAYRRYQIERENDPLEPGPGFPFVDKLLRINELLDARRVDIVLLSRNSADTGLRVFNSIAKHGLQIVRAAFSSGASPYRYAAAFNCDLFLSAEHQDVERALESGVAAATLLSTEQSRNPTAALKIAFDGDAVLFSDQAERVYSERGLSAFEKAEKQAADRPLGGGPFKPFLKGLHRLQQEFKEDCPIRTALVTARGAPAHERVIKTLRSWDIRLDESLFLGGLDKAAFLSAYEADVFFDDHPGNCASAQRHVTAGHVPHGVRNLRERE